MSECSPQGETKLCSFDTSCFSGIYTTGENIEDKYFSNLHTLRNDDAKQKREVSDGQGMGKNSHDGCESVSNDKRPEVHKSSSCESLSNGTNDAAASR